MTVGHAYKEPLLAGVGEVDGTGFKLDAVLDAKAGVDKSGTLVIGTELHGVVRVTVIGEGVAAEKFSMERLVGFGEERGVRADVDAGDEGGVVVLVGGELEGAILDGVAVELRGAVVAGEGAGEEGSKKKSKEMHGGESGE